MRVDFFPILISSFKKYPFLFCLLFCCLEFELLVTNKYLKGGSRGRLRKAIEESGE